MLFNSYVFLFAFLPITLGGFFLLGRMSRVAAAAWLTAASLVFYGYWSPRYVALLLASAAFNYGMGYAIVHSRPGSTRAYRLLVLAVVADLALLGYYKYANFFVTTAATVAGTTWSLAPIILPLGISFFTFTQIAFLVDAYRGKVTEYRPVHFLLFVTYFPHLIAGPVLHHAEMMPQFEDDATYRPRAEHFAVGLTIFVIGLLKKVILADGIGAYVSPVFDLSRATPFGFLEAWGGALSYTLQLYFDFSGYSDMAIGLSRMFGIILPLNFDSPYKSRNIIEFWRRWHMTLSRFLRDYLYIPLGGSRRGSVRRYVNLLLTMLLGGLWHGAGWTFVIWGALHGCYLMINHFWHYLRGDRDSSVARARLGVFATFMSVVIAWVFFRATSVDSAIGILRGMVGLNGIVIPPNWFHALGSPAWLAALGVSADDVGRFGGVPQMLWIAALLVLVWGFPNTQDIMRRYRPALDCAPDHHLGSGRFVWAPSVRWAVATGVGALVGIAAITKVSTFLYYQF
jgi:alginate O-acetyltransferase complex protein AlgI